MKVNIETNEIETGLFRKRKHYQVQVGVVFTETEKAIIKTNELDNLIVMERDVPSDRKKDDFVPNTSVFNLNVYMLSQIDRYAFSTPHEASEYIEKLKHQLKLLKQHLENAGNAELGSESFEL